ALPERRSIAGSSGSLEARLLPRKPGFCFAEGAQKPGFEARSRASMFPSRYPIRGRKTRRPRPSAGAFSCRRSSLLQRRDDPLEVVVRLEPDHDLSAVLRLHLDLDP